jgi:ATP-dependent Clp protease ATP-binding subunit ClpB
MNAMNMNQLTLKSQEALQSAQQYAFEKNHPQIENEHLLHGLIETDTSVIPYLFNKLNLNLEVIKSLNEKHLNSLPTVNGCNQVF